MRIFIYVISFLLLLNNAFGAGCYDDIKASNEGRFKDYEGNKKLLWWTFKNKNRKEDIIVYRVGLFSKDNVIMRESSYELLVPAKKERKFGLNVTPRKYNINLADAGEGFWFCKYTVKDDNEKKGNKNKKKSFDSKGTLEKILGIN